MEQREIIEPIDLLNEFGELNAPGFSRHLVQKYDRKKIKAPKFKIKEWDYYIIHNGEYGIALTIADNSYMSLVSASFFDFGEHPFEKTVSSMKPFSNGKINMPSSSENGDIHYQDKNVKMDFYNDGKKRHLVCDYINFDGEKRLGCDIVLSNMMDESMVIATPFKENKKAFYYNQKINCMDAVGTIKYGKTVVELKKGEAYGTLDWGRGVWTYENTWYWGSMSTVIDGHRFGFNIGYGFGDTSAATENMLFVDGKAHKLDQVTFNIPLKDGKDDFLSPWTFTSNDGRFEMNFTPILDRIAYTSALIILSDQHQIFGKFNGKVILDDGRSLEVKDKLGFAEKVRNKW